MSRLLIPFALVTWLGSAAHADAPEDQLYACKEPAPSAKLTVSFKPEASLVDLATWVTSFTCKNVVFSADVAKRATKVTVVSAKAMTPKQALELFVDAVEATGMVVTVKRDTILIKLGPSMPKSCPDLADKSKPEGGELAGNPFEAAEAPLDAELDAGIKTIGANRREITRALVDRVFANPMAVAKEARLVPAVKDGKPIGVKLYAIRPGSLFARLGFVNGDLLMRINGFDVTQPDKALEVYTKLRDAKQLVFSIVRQGKALELIVDIK
ncbi:MAG: hypothetical protein IPQ07_14105 [Myxococcales bacterium]|nr:hypothetical protein [Myxococcales bacterium]